MRSKNIMAVGEKCREGDGCGCGGIRGVRYKSDIGTK